MTFPLCKLNVSHMGEKFNKKLWESAFAKIEILNSTLKSSGGIYFCMSSVYLCISPWYDLPVLLTAVEGEYHEQIYTRKPETPYP